MSKYRDKGKKKWISNRRGGKLSKRKGNEIEVDGLRHYSLNKISDFQEVGQILPQITQIC